MIQKKVLQNAGEWWAGCQQLRKKWGGAEDVTHVIVPSSNASFLPVLSGAFVFQVLHPHRIDIRRI